MKRKEGIDLHQIKNRHLGEGTGLHQCRSHLQEKGTDLHQFRNHLKGGRTDLHQLSNVHQKEGIKIDREVHQVDLDQDHHQGCH